MWHNHAYFNLFISLSASDVSKYQESLQTKRGQVNEISAHSLHLSSTVMKHEDKIQRKDWYFTGSVYKRTSLILPLFFYIFLSSNSGRCVISHTAAFENRTWIIKLCWLKLTKTKKGLFLTQTQTTLIIFFLKKSQ